MRKLLWMIFLFGVYVWMMTSGHDRFLLKQTKQVVEAMIAWFDDAELDFQLEEKKPLKPKKKGRRWD